MKVKAAFFLSLLLLVTCSCTPAADPDATGTLFPIYFLAPAGTAPGSDALQCSDELLDLGEYASASVKAKAVVERLLLGSSDGVLLSPFPEGTTLRSLVIRNTHAYVDLSGISRLKGIELTLANYALALSLSSIEEIDSVILYCENRLLPQQARQILKPQDVLLSTGNSVLQQMEITLYFPDENNLLTPEQRTLDIYEGETQTAVLITALLAGPQDSLLHSVIPEDFVITSIRVDDGICRINIPSASLQILPEDEETQSLILWSLAESLYSLDYIQEIRFITDGAELDRFGLIPVASVIERPSEESEETS